MKIRFFSLLVALVMLLGMASASASATFPSPQDTGIDVLWLTVPWEDKGRDVLFGIRFNEHRSLFGNATISIDILEQGTAAWNALYADLDKESQDLADENYLMLLDISLLDEDGNKLDTSDLNVTMFVQHGRSDPEKEMHFYYVAAGRDEAYRLALVPCPDYGNLDESVHLDKFFSITMNHFSPFALYMEGEPVAEPVPEPEVKPEDKPEASTPVTGDNSRLLLWGSLMVLAMGGMVFLSGKRSKKVNG